MFSAVGRRLLFPVALTSSHSLPRSFFLFRIFPQSMYLLFRFSMASLYIGEIVFVAYMGIKKGTYQGIAAIVLVVITAIWHMKVPTVAMMNLPLLGG